MRISDWSSDVCSSDLATRAQADRSLYRRAIRTRLQSQTGLTIFQQSVDDLMLEGDKVVGAVTKIGLRFRGRTVVLTAGTFLNGLIHVGLDHYSAGRDGDQIGRASCRERVCQYV